MLLRDGCAKNVLLCYFVPQTQYRRILLHNFIVLLWMLPCYSPL